MPIEYFHVLEIERWRYSGFESCIYMDRYHESRNRGDSPIKGPRGATGFVAYNSKNSLFGLMEYYFENDGVYLGIAINPEFVGRGLSKEYILEGIKFFKSHFKESKVIKLEVHRKNIQAIKSYESCGFLFKKRTDDILLYVYI